MKQTRISYRILHLGLALSLVIIALIAIEPVTQPASVKASAPATVFSAERAMADLQVIAAKPHATGNPAQAIVRDHILAQFSAHGIAASIQSDIRYQNIIATMPGSDPTGIVLVTAHYDSVAGAPGAGDDGISVAAMIEAMRVLSASALLRNDVVFLFTDAEELGLKGAHSFVTKSPLAQEIRVVLAFEGAPGHGPTRLEQTSPGDAWVIRNLVKARPPIFAISNINKDARDDFDSDFDVFAQSGFRGLILENNGTVDQHTSRDNPSAIDLRLIQNHGEAMLSLVNQFGAADLRQAADGPDLAFTTLPVLRVIAYPAWLNDVIGWVMAGVLAGVIVVAFLQKQIKPVAVVVSAVAITLFFFAFTYLSEPLWDRLLDASPGSRTGYFPDFPGSDWVITVSIAIMTITFIVLITLLVRFGGIVSTSAGALIALLSVAFFLAGKAAFDFGSPWKVPLLVWSWFGAVISLAIVAFVKNERYKVLGLALAAVPAFLMIMPVIVIDTAKPSGGVQVPVVETLVLLAALVPQLAYLTDLGHADTRRRLDSVPV